MRIVVSGDLTGRLLADVRRRWDADSGTYKTTGQDWAITDSPSAYEAWRLAFGTMRAAALLAEPALPRVRPFRPFCLPMLRTSGLAA